jgi:hypothetical protein
MTYNDGTVEEGRWNEDVFHKRWELQVALKVLAY